MAVAFPSLICLCLALSYRRQAQLQMPARLAPNDEDKKALVRHVSSVLDDDDDDDDDDDLDYEGHDDFIEDAVKDRELPFALGALTSAKQPSYISRAFDLDPADSALAEPESDGSEDENVSAPPPLSESSGTAESTGVDIGMSSTATEPVGQTLESPDSIGLADMSLFTRQRPRMSLD